MGRSLTVRELIIETNLQVQRLAGNRRSKTDDDITIWRLNTAQDRIIKDRIKPDQRNPGRYLLDQKSNSDIQTIKTPNVKLISFKDTDTRSYGVLPYDFGYLLNDRSRVIEDCKTEFTTSLVSNAVWNVTKLPFNDSVLGAGPYYVNIIVRKDATSSTVTSSGVISKKEKFGFIDSVIKAFKDIGVDVYWEVFDSVFQPNCFLAVAPFPFKFDGTAFGTPPVIGLTIDGTSVTASILPTKGINGDGTWYRYKALTSSLRESPNRSIKDDFLYDALSYNYYEQSEADSPISQIMNNKLYVFSNKKFLISEIIIDYIRKPRPISLSLNQTSELDGELHEEICSIAAEMILGNVEAANYPQKVQENLNRLE